MKPKHTPGPWQVANDNEPWRIIGNVDGGYGDDGNGVVSEEVCEISESDRMEGNRALVIASPQLLEAARVALSLLMSATDFYKSWGAIESLSAAIAAAEGK